MTSAPELFVNPHTGPVSAAPAADAIGVHRRLPGYTPTPLVDCAAIARDLGVGQLWVKDESSRLGLPSFKILGAAYAVYRTLAERLGGIEDTWSGIADLRSIVAPLRPFTLAAATDGNHGRAVAYMARLLEFGARIYVPAGTTAERIKAIEGEGATVEVVDGDYDAAVRRSAQDESDHCAVVSDTSWPGYERTPGWVIDGYATIFREVDDTLAGRGEQPPALVVIPVGVGALAAATVRHYRAGNGAPPRILGVEPADAACVLASLRADDLTTVSGPHRSIMVGLNCGTPSRIAWPALRRGLDAVVAIDDDAARDAMRALASAGLVSGETGAAALAGLRQALEDRQLRSAWQLGPESRVLVLSTEGATDAASYEQIVTR